jgi:hypothetical protein
MNTWSVFDKVTGEFIGQTFSTDQQDYQAPTDFPDGHGVIEGLHDHLSKRVDVATGEVVDYQPPQPSADFEWNAEMKRWQLTAAAAAKIDGNASARARIAVLENAQHRAVREAMLDPLGGIARLKAINDEIASLRPQLQ